MDVATMPKNLHCATFEPDISFKTPEALHRTLESKDKIVWY
jgi:hypothetical protein